MRCGMAEKWKMEGTLFDSCNCTTLCPCVYGQVPTHGDCHVTAVWHVARGTYGTKTKLDGLNFAGVFYASQNPLMGVDRAAMLVDAGLPFKPTPRKAQTYDPLFLNGEKVVGITERHVANISGLTRSLAGTYSSSGRFSYKGP